MRTRERKDAGLSGGKGSAGHPRTSCPCCLVSGASMVLGKNGEGSESWVEVSEGVAEVASPWTRHAQKRPAEGPSGERRPEKTAL